MYLNYFGLSKSPFGITPDTSLFFEGAERGDVLEAILYALNAGEGIIKVVGEVGSGKTMLSRMLSRKIPDNTVLVFLLNPNIKAEEVLYAIAHDLGLEIDTSESSIEVLHRLQAQLLTLFQQGKKVVLVIDEAQQMPLSTLEEIRLLSNLETETQKLLQIVLFGQPELDQHLDTVHIRQLRERIAYSFYLTPLSWKAAEKYLQFRLAKAGHQGRIIFKPNAIKLLSKYSDGTLRRLNMLADKALLAAFLDQKPVVETKHVRTALRDNYKGQKKTSKTGLFFSLMLAVLIMFVAVYWVLNSSPDHADRIGVNSSGGRPDEQQVQQRRVNQTAIERPSNSSPKVNDADSLTFSSSDTMVTAPLVSSSEPDSASKSSVGVIAGSISVEDSDVSNVDAVASATLLRQRLAAFELWRRQNTNSEVYTIRLLMAKGGEIDPLERFLRRIKSMADIDQAYVSTLSTQNGNYVVYYGEFLAYSDASNAMDFLPGSLKKFSPYISLKPK